MRSMLMNMKRIMNTYGMTTKIHETVSWPFLHKKFRNQVHKAIKTTLKTKVSRLNSVMTMKTVPMTERMRKSRAGEQIPPLKNLTFVESFISFVLRGDFFPFTYPAVRYCTNKLRYSLQGVI